MSLTVWVLERFRIDFQLTFHGDNSGSVADRFTGLHRNDYAIEQGSPWPEAALLIVANQNELADPRLAEQGGWQDEPADLPCLLVQIPILVGEHLRLELGVFLHIEDQIIERDLAPFFSSLTGLALLSKLSLGLGGRKGRGDRIAVGGKIGS